MKFVQFSDSHLDSSISARLCLPADKQETLRQDLRRAFARACELARETKAELLLIPGDLFDDESVSVDTSSFIAESFRALEPTRIFIAPGNHDSLRPGSPYALTSGVAWSENLHIFRSGQFDSVAIDGLDCSVTGIAHVHRGITKRVLRQRINRPAASINILLIHGSRDGYGPSDKEVTLPFSDAELLDQEFTYAAIGHYHTLAVIEDSSGPRAAYSGCTQGRGLDETGRKCAVIGEIERGQVRIEPVETSQRRIVTLEACVTGATDVVAILSRVENALLSAQVRKDDLAYVTLTGSLAPQVTLDLNGIAPRFDCFHVTVDTGPVEPDYDLDALCRESAAENVKSAFARRMRESIDCSTNEEDQHVLRDATFYGLHALDGRKLEPRDVD